ncbi:Hybrid signal transduction histidine kinase E, putative [Theobroma cacao]|uniref:histidine kinase n=1 Tax=Theobroma cacao TaxID=3641 RepID=A0A061DZ28_THECC|nr:Hybrid signal transduction histidine kinase E, putative [Theobroma cacao]
MKLSTFIVARPIFVFISLALLILLLSSLVISCWYKITRRIEDNVDLNTQNLYSGLLYEIESIANLVHPLNSSATKLARLLSRSVNQSEISFNEIETKVAPILFQALSTIPYISQISYVGLDGLLFSYYIDGNQTLSIYANSSLSSNSSSVKERKKNVWYKQPVDDNSGKLYGEAVRSHSLDVVNTSWFQTTLNDSKGYSSVEKRWNSAGDPLFLNSASIHGRGVVSLAFPVKRLTDIYAGIDLYGGSLSLATKDGKMLVDGIPNTKLISVNNSIALQFTKLDGEVVYAQNFTCTPRNDTSATYIMDIGEKKYCVHCSPVEISGVQSVYALALPHEGLVSLVHMNSKLSLILLVVMIVMVMISIFSFVLLMVRTAERKMCLHAKLIKQMEATQQAERKSMNKSLALAGASHDIRASLAGITGLIDLCLTDAAPRSDFEAYLKQMRNCAQDLLGLLNSILDTSKIEAGMMNLEEEEFNLAELLEHLVDLYHPVGMKKGIDVVLDPCDGSVIKFSQVKGDRGKLMQILSNLLSNAVKFTPEGHVSLRAWVQKPDIESAILASGRNGLHKYLSCLFHNINEARSDMEVITAVRQNPNSMEFVFEVDDTGKGIPKEKQQSVFENFVQVKETATGQVGTGLGLGIVQSLVRLLGGEIGIVDKEIGEKGSCFRFNVFFTTMETSSSGAEGEKESQGDPMLGGTQQHSGLTIHTPSPSSTVRTSSPRLPIRSPSTKLEGSQVVLLIQSDERRRISQKFMESLGISVLVVDRWESLPSALKKIKSKLISSHHSSRRLDLSSRSDISSTSSKDMPLSAMDGTEHKLPLNKRRGAPSFILLVIDANAGPFSELWRVVSEFRRGLHGICFKVVWLDKPTSRSINSISLEKERLDPDDEILLQPFHGSRLYQVIKLLPEFGGTLSQGISANLESSSATKNSYITARSRNPLHNEEIQEDASSSDERYRQKGFSSAPAHTHVRLNSKISPIHQLGQTETKTDGAESSTKQPLSGKRILIAEDSTLLGKLATVIVRRLGANAEHCENGEEALKLVCNGLKDQRNDGGHYVLPYDYILMDCEMPIMNGYEATRRIRNEERRYGVHIPIIALTAHTSGVEASNTLQAGMDAHLGKPLNAEELMEAIENIHHKRM